MRPFLDLLDLFARLGVWLVQAGYRRRILLSGIGLALTTVVAAAYVTIFGVGINPAQKTISVRVMNARDGADSPSP